MAAQLKADLRVSFPAIAVEACVRENLAIQAEDQAVLRGTEYADGSRDSTWEPEIDSLVVVEIICAIEELLGTDLPADFAPKGGYPDVNSCVRDLLAKAAEAWDQRNLGAR